ERDEEVGRGERQDPSQINQQRLECPPIQSSSGTDFGWRGRRHRPQNAAAQMKYWGRAVGDVGTDGRDRRDYNMAMHRKCARQPGPDYLADSSRVIISPKHVRLPTHCSTSV